MTDDRDPEATLREWTESMRAEHANAIASPDPDVAHRIEGVAQVTYRVSFAFDRETGSLEREASELVDDFDDPELLSCVCGVRGMAPSEAREHMAAATGEPSGES